MSSQVANIHDAFFKQVLSDQQAAGTFLRVLDVALILALH
jgi:hypothetical protein